MITHVNYNKPFSLCTLNMNAVKSKYDILKERLYIVMNNSDHCIRIPDRITKGNRIETIECAIKDVYSLKFNIHIESVKYVKKEFNDYVFEINK